MVVSVSLAESPTEFDSVAVGDFVVVNVSSLLRVSERLMVSDSGSDGVTVSSFDAVATVRVVTVQVSDMESEVVCVLEGDAVRVGVKGGVMVEVRVSDTSFVSLLLWVAERVTDVSDTEMVVWFVIESVHSAVQLVGVFVW